ncbi:MAG TPA: hypothetical protein VM369_10480 [Candidatus Binatia bacterium]|nr:hypothetical protein [Candidatus Binatia bacterium]
MRFAAALLLAAASTTVCAQRGTFADPALDETSGLARSLREADLYWAHNDSGDGPVLYRSGPGGESLGAVTVPAARAVDWEDIASFQDRGQPALLIADTGDNFALRNSVTLYAVRDPGRGDDVALLWRLEFRWPDGPRDCEAVAVDASRGEILLLSKRDSPPRLYRLPLPDRTPRAVKVAEPLGVLPGIPGRLLERPTAMDLSPDGRRLLVLTQRHLYLYRAQPGGWGESVTQPPRVVELPLLAQAEGAAFDASGRRVLVGSEGHPSRFVWVDLPR